MSQALSGKCGEEPRQNANIDGSQTLNQQQKNMQGLDLDPLHIVSDVRLGLHVSPLRAGMGAVPDYVACHWNPYPYLDFMVPPQ